jgi:hypothetical protein
MLYAELIKSLKEMAVICYKTEPQNFSARDFNPGSPEYRAVVITITQ